MRVEIYGCASVKGKLHEQSNIPNQDSYVVKRYKFGTILVVSDGMGSHAHSEVGSKAVCKAVCQAVQFWNQSKCRNIRLLIPLIHSMWGIEIFPYLKNDCGATCLFAFLDNNGMLYIGQLGDGNILISIDDEVELFKTKEDEFSNFTSGINNISSFTEWNLKTYEVSNRNLKLCLMTDGVSETLIEDTKTEFVKLLWKKAAERDNLISRNNFLYQILYNWNEVNSGDDRTIVSFEKK